MLKFILQSFFECLRFENGILIGTVSWLVIIYFTVLLVIICRDVIHNKYISANTDKVETENVEALVVDKKCKEGRTIQVGKVPVCVGNIFMVELFLR